MEQSRKHLKITSIVVLIFASLSLINVTTSLFFGDLMNVEFPVGSAENMVMIAQIFVLAVSAILRLPHIYIGVKGLRVAKNPNSSKGHIIWAMILFVFAILGLISPVVGLVQRTEVSENVSTLLGVLLDIAIFFDYIKHARAISQAMK